MDLTTLLPVIIGSDQNAYGIARSFHEAYGVCSVLLARRTLSATENSRILRYAVLEERLEEDEVFVDTLLSYAKSTEGKTRILIPCSDAYARLAARNRKRLEGHYLFALTDEETLEFLSQKESFYQMCREHGLSFPETYEFDPKTQTPEVPFAFPIVAKPADSAAYWNCSFEGKRKVFFLRSQDELSDVTARLAASDYNGKLLLQEFIPGDDSAMRVVNAYLDRDGECRLFCVGQVLLEEHTPEGIGSYAAILPTEDPALYDLLLPILKSLSYRGFLNIDVKIDPRDGSYRFFELNPRQGRSSFFVTAAGANLARVLTEDLLGLPASTPLFPCEDVLWCNIPACILRRYVKAGDTKRRALSAARAGRVCHQLRYKPDFSLARRKYYLLNQLNQWRKYRRHFIDKLALSDTQGGH